MKTNRTADPQSVRKNHANQMSKMITGLTIKANNMIATAVPELIPFMSWGLVFFDQP